MASFLSCDEMMVRYERRCHEDGCVKPTARSGHVLIPCAERNSVLLHGGLGLSDLEFWNDTWECDADTQIWRPLRTTGDSPSNAFGQCGVLLRDGVTLFVQGGLGNRNRYFDDAYTLDLRTLVWKRAPLCGDALPQMWGQSIVSVLVQGEERLVIFGGMTLDTASADVFIIDPQSWDVKRVDCRASSKLQCSARRRHGAVVLYDAFMMIAGGRNEKEFFNDVWVLNCATMMWVPITAAASPALMRDFFSSPYSSTPGTNICKLYERAPKTDKKMYDFYSSWYPRTGLSMVACNNVVYVFGGFFYCSQGLATFDDLHAYDVAEHRWERVMAVPNSVVESQGESSPAPATPPRCTMASIAAMPNSPNTLLFFGGRVRDDPIDQHFSMTILKPQRSLAQLTAQWLKSCPTPVDCAVAPPGVQHLMDVTPAYKYANAKQEMTQC